MLKYITLASCFLFIGLGSLRSQTTTNMTPTELRAFREKQIMDAYKEKRHIEDENIPAIKNSGGKQEENESPLSVGETRISTSTPESEVHAAINPKDTTNIVVGPIHISPASGMILPIYYTTNFGTNWKKSTFQPLPYEAGAQVSGGGDPVFAYDADGKLYFSWIDTYATNITSDSDGWTVDTSFSATYWASSTNGGQTWQRSKTGYIARGFYSYTYLIDTVTFTLKSEHIDTNTGFHDKQWMACDRSNSQYHNSLYVAWTYLGTTSSNILVARKVAGVDSMLPPVKASPDDFITVQFSSLGVDAHGGLHITFMGSKDNANFGIYTVYSSDGGKSFAAPVKIADADIPSRSADAIEDGYTIYGVRAPGNYPCPHLSIDTAGTGNLYEVWCALGVEADSGFGAQVYFSRSTDNGSTWSLPSIINNDLDTEFGFIDHFYPSIAVNGKGMISVTWYDRREDPSDIIGRYYIGQSTDQGQTWTNAPVASQPMDFSAVFNVNQNFGIGEYTQVLTTPNYTIPIWTDGRDDAGGLRIYAAFLNGANSGVNRLTTVGEGLELSDNYPNPFTGTTKFSFNVESSVHARLYITNVAGQTVSSMFNGTAEVGEHDFSFDGSHLANGVYYVNLESDLGVVRRAMTILR